VRSAEHAARLKARAFEALVLGETVPGEWDAILDTTGHWLAPAIGALAPFGRVVVIFAPGDGRPQVPVRDLYRRGASIVGINSLAYKPADCARLFSELAPAFESGELQAPEGIVVRPLSQAVESYAALQRGQKGKLVIVP
jgi:NADPH:quinone reductase